VVTMVAVAAGAIATATEVTSVTTATIQRGTTDIKIYFCLV
jgi:hypothetical protein